MFLVQAVNVASAVFIAAHTAIIYELQYCVTKGSVQEYFLTEKKMLKLPFLDLSFRVMGWPLIHLLQITLQ
jgi:hypothetical protein